jgi:hypothetical protein
VEAARQPDVMRACNSMKEVRRLCCCCCCCCCWRFEHSIVLEQAVTSPKQARLA